MGAERCPECSAELPAGARFCAHCGVPLELAVARTPRDERRVITALFADLSGSTRLGELLDPEDFRDLTGGALALMGAAIEEVGGTVRGTAGDGVLGLFGAPTAHEDDAERAVIAGLRLVERMRDYGADAARRWGVPPLGVRVGIETGLAILGEVRAGSQVQYDATGDCLNTAARLEGAADVGGVLVGPLTHRLLNAAFDWGEARPLVLKGKADTVLARHALASRRDRLPPWEIAGPGSRLVGRDRELASAGDLVADVRANVPRAVFITGPAGIGKTRFTRELRSLFEAVDHDASAPTWLEGTCLSYAVDEPYLPFRQILRQALGRGIDSPDALAAALAALVGSQQAEDLAPLLGLVLGFAPGSDASFHDSSRSAESLQQAVTATFVALVRALASRGPVAIALDDLHWVDSASLRLVEDLLSELTSGLPVLLALTMRPERDRAAWTMREQSVLAHPVLCTELALSSLDRVGERGLIVDLIGHDTLPADLESTLLDRAEGNPFYLRELLRSLQDSGAIVPDAGQWHFDPDVVVELPETVERVVLARIDRLPPVERDLLNSAAVIGREFDLLLLGRLAEVDVSPASLANLIRLGLVEATSGPEFRFSHPLVQETAYRSMLRRGRAALHGRAAAAIEERAGNTSAEHHAALARHHRAAGHVSEAVRYHRLAAIAAERVVALDEATAQLDLALEAAVLDPPSAPLLPELHLMRGRLRGRTGDYDGGRDDLRQALAMGRTIHDPQVEVRALNELGWLIRVHGYEESIRHHQEALRIAEDLGDPGQQVTALSRMSMIYLNRLQLDEGLELAQRAVHIARATGRDELLGTALDCLKLAALQLGHLDLLERTGAEIVEVQGRAGDLYLLQWAYIEGATVPLARGDLAEASRRIGQAVTINQRFSSDRIARALILEARSWIDRASGDPEAAVGAVREGMQMIAEHPTPEWSAWLEASLGSHLLATGSVAAAITALESAVRHSETINSPNRAYRAASHLARARQLAGDEPGSRAALAHAKDLAARITVPPGEVFLDGYHSHLALARTCIDHGDPRGAAELLDPLVSAARAHGWLAAEHEAAALRALLP